MYELSHIVTTIKDATCICICACRLQCGEWWLCSHVLAQQGVQLV